MGRSIYFEMDSDTLNSLGYAFRERNYIFMMFGDQDKRNNLIFMNRGHGRLYYIRVLERVSSYKTNKGS